ncbi:hypothetical protein HanPSC8_Chr11g0472881 [Helianthus annuus]|nr:hypothetical protein HanPSC8_Chr11g0472881 [Helianthus annuus]
MRATRRSGPHTLQKKKKIVNKAHFVRGVSLLILTNIRTEQRGVRKLDGSNIRRL